MVKEILESTPSGMKDLDSFKETPSVNPFPGEFYCKTNMCWSLEHANVPCYKLIVTPIVNRVGKPKTMRKEMLSPNEKDKIRENLLSKR